MLQAHRRSSGRTRAQVQEEKGLDQVRRDWCPLSKEAGRFALRHILSGAPPEEVVQAIHDNLRAVRGQFLTGA